MSQYKMKNKWQEVPVWKDMSQIILQQWIHYIVSPPGSSDEFIFQPQYVLLMMYLCQEKVKILSLDFLGSQVLIFESIQKISISSF